MAGVNITLKDAIEVVVGGGGVGGVLRWIDGRKKVRADTFATTVDTLQNRLSHTETRLDKVEDEHAECRERLAAGERERAELRQEINRLMALPIASYPPRRAPK